MLGIAAFMGHTGVVETLLEFGADVNAMQNSKVSHVPRNTALHAAIAGGCDVSLVELLLLHGADVNKLDSNHHTPLQAAAFHGNVDIAVRLIAAGADVLTAEGGSSPAIAIAESSGHRAFADYLQRNGTGTKD